MLPVYVILPKHSSMFNAKEHWEKIYRSKPIIEFSWYEQIPETSLAFLRQFNVPLDAKIIDVGGGDSYFVDNLLALGYSDVTVLDISDAAIARAKERLGKDADKVKWIVADAATFVPQEKYDFWHDRAAFHFLTNDVDVTHYVKMIRNGLSDNGVLVIGTFSETGPKKCSGIEIKQYSEESLSDRLQKYFKKIKCVAVDHVTPFKTVQNFIFCSFKQAA